MTYVDIYRSVGDSIKIGLNTDTDFIGRNLTLSGGGRNRLTLGYKDSVTEGDKAIYFNPEATNDAGANRVSLANGDFVFYNMKQLNFVDTDTNITDANKKTFTLQSGTINSATFQFDRSLIATTSPSLRAGSDTSTTIMIGNLTALNGKSLRFSLIDDTDITEQIDTNTLKTLQVDGTITITGGGLSLFYNDRLGCFEAKLTATGGIKQTGGYIGRNDAFFESGTFGENIIIDGTPTDNRDLLTIQGTNGGISHLRFNDIVSVSHGIGANGGNGTELYFYQGASISAFDDTTRINTESEGSAIYISGSGSNNITFGGSTTNTITGNITANNSGTNNITATTGTLDIIGTLAVGNGGINNISANTITINGAVSGNSTGSNNNANNIIATNLIFSSSATGITAGTSTDGWGVKNRFDISGTTTLSSENFVIKADSTFNPGGAKYNIIKFGTALSANAKIAEITSISRDNSGDDLTKTKNILSFDSLSSPTTLTITDINKSTSIPSGKRTGYNYIGKNLTSGSGSSLDFNSEFTNSTWIEDKYQATNLTLNVTNINMSKGGNYISVGTLNTVNITNDGGQNNILANTFSNTSKIDAGWEGTTNIYVKESLDISGSITAGAYNGNSNGGSAGVNNIHLIGDSASGIISGNIGIGTNGNANIQNNFYLSGANTTLTTTGTISFNTNGNGQNNFTLSGDNATLKLRGQNNAITTVSGYVAPTRTAGYSTLILDGANATVQNSGVTATISNAIDTGNLIINFNGDTNNIAQLTLGAGGNNLYGIALGSQTNTNSTNNTLTLSQGTTSITIDTVIANGQDLTIDFEGGSNTSLTNNINIAGVANINFNGSDSSLMGKLSATSGVITINVGDDASGTITGNIAQSNGGTNNVVFKGGIAKLTLQGSNNTLSLVDSTNAGTLSLDSNNASTTTVAQLKNNNLTANFGGTDKVTKLVLENSDSSDKTIALAGVTLENNSTNNTLDLTSLTSITISGAVSVASTQGLTIALGSTDMTFGEGLGGSSVLSVSGTSSFATTSGDIVANTLNLVGDGSAKATFKNTTTTLSTLNANAKGGNTLALDTSNNNDVAVTLSNTLDGVLSIELNGSATNSTSLTLNSGTIQGIKATEGNNNKVIFSNGNNIINNAIDSTSVASGKGLTLQVNNSTILYAKGGIDNSGGGTINMELNNNSKLYLGATSSLNSLTASGAVINIANMEIERPTRAITRNTLTIGDNNNGSYKGNAEFIIYVGGGQADNIVFNNVEKKDGVKSSATITATGSYYSILNGNHTLVATLNDTGYSSTDGSTDNMEKLQGGEVLIGGSLIKTTLIEESDSNGVVKYYLGKGEDVGAPIQYQEVASSALTVNYDLFLANFNSLNKRMGELRDDANNNGVWARVFGGAMSNDFGAGSKTDYITAQAGYDYSLSVGNNARNHLGIAVAYGTSNTQGNALSMNGLLGSSGSISLNEVDSNMVEVGIYNTFISDSGWYNDTIFKFDYIMSKFSLSNKTDLFTDTSNFAMVLSDEFGYRYKFGENEKGSWYIDPQLEMAFGYFNQSDFNRAMYDATGTTLDTIMRATQDTILTLRTRVGASLGKKFNTDKGFASLYVGAFYEYDYINGGNASVEGQIGGTVKSLDSIESNGRAILNVGSNIELTKGARLYIDVEKSFGDKQRTFMQFNLGARYSF